MGKLLLANKRVWLVLAAGIVALVGVAVLMLVPLVYSYVMTDNEASAMPDTAQTFPTTGTACRPSFLPFFTLGHNNLNPTLTTSDAGLQIKVVKTTGIPWDQIEKADLRDGLKSKYLVLTCGKWEYIAHFRDDQALHELIQLLQTHGVMLSSAATENLNQPNDS